MNDNEKKNKQKYEKKRGGHFCPPPYALVCG